MSEQNRPLKSIESSQTEQIHLLRYEDINGENRLFGGKLVSWIDEVAGVVAKRHSGMKVTTASIDHLQFKQPAFLDDLIVIIGRLTYVGNTSMEVRVDTYLEDSTGQRQPINRAFITLVTLDEANNPCRIPYGIKIETTAQQGDYESALKRIELRKMRQGEGY
ncbi:MAG: acyl-CoA thioesterase [Lachnospiraceae bacterium]|nr:acyl-CoA thioesterase [Lachnospiraceae bacterium]